MTSDVNLDRRVQGSDRLLPGEVLDSEHPHDAEHWVAVYKEMVAFLLLVDFDVSETLERCRRRLEHWGRRLDGHVSGASERQCDQGWR